MQVRRTFSVRRTSRHVLCKYEENNMTSQPKKLNINKTNLLLDIAVFIAFLFAMDPRTTGIAIHEWLSIAFGAAMIVHLLLHWKWIVTVTQRFFRKIATKARLNYVLNVLFFIDMTLVIFTGIMISEAALPALGIRLQENFTWRFLHSFTADFSVVILGLHTALHWKWIVDSFKRYLIQPFIPARRVPVTVQKEVQS